MYNEDKKLIGDLARNVNFEENIKDFVVKAGACDFAYAAHKFALNYVMMNDILEDEEETESIDAIVGETMTSINALMDKYMKPDAPAVDVADTNAMYAVRDAITKKMQVITTYADIFQLYEYVLNRKQYSFDENVTDELQGVYDDFSTEKFGNNIVEYIFQDEDNVAVKTRLREIAEQLPIRMTKAKFYDMIEEALSLYNGSDATDIDNYAKNIKEAVGITKPEDFDTEYLNLKSAHDILAKGDYAHLTFDDYKIYKDAVDVSVDFIRDTADVLILLMELVNDMCVMLLHKDVAADAEATTKIVKFQSDIRSAVESGDDETKYTLLDSIVGKQEEYGEHRYMFQSALEDLVDNQCESLVELGYFVNIRDLQRSALLLSGSAFVELNTSDEPEPVAEERIADMDYIANVCAELTAALGEEFAKNGTAYNRAIMAKIIGMLPMFFRGKGEVEAYVVAALDKAKSRGELLGCLEIIDGIIDTGDMYDFGGEGGIYEDNIF